MSKHIWRLNSSLLAVYKTAWKQHRRISNLGEFSVNYFTQTNTRENDKKSKADVWMQAQLDGADGLTAPSETVQSLEAVICDSLSSDSYTL